MKELTTREDLHLLVNTFYTQVRKDAIIGPIFNTLIGEENWPAHISRMLDFWECNLFFRPTFKGNPGQTHQKVDANYNFYTNEHHYERWVEPWHQTVDQHFEGDKSRLAKIRTMKMGKQLLAKVNEGKSLFNISA